MTNPTVRVAQDATGESVALAKLMNKNSSGEDAYSQVCTEAALSGVYLPFFDPAGAARVITTPDATDIVTGSSYQLNPIPAEMLANAIDVSDASCVTVYGSISITDGAAEVGFVISPFVITDDDKVSMPLPRIAPYFISPPAFMTGNDPVDKQGVFRAEENGEVQIAFEPFQLQTLGAKRIVFHVAVYGPFNSVIIHATKTSFSGNAQRLHEGIYNEEWGSKLFNSYSGGI